MNDFIEISPSNAKVKGDGKEETFQESDECTTQNLNEKTLPLQNTKQSIVPRKDGVSSPVNETESTQREDNNEPQSEPTNNKESQKPEAQIVAVEVENNDYDDDDEKSDSDVFYPSHLEDMVHKETMRQLELAWNAQRQLAMLCCEDIKEIGNQKQ